MRIGQHVMLVGSDGYMPPFGAVGVIVGPLDTMGDHEVLFPDHPCPVGREITWEAHHTWLMPLEPHAGVVLGNSAVLELHVSVTNWPAPDVTSHGPAGSSQGISGSEQ